MTSAGKLTRIAFCSFTRRLNIRPKRSLTMERTTSESARRTVSCKVGLVLVRRRIVVSPSSQSRSGYTIRSTS